MEILPPELQAATVAIVVLSLGVVTVCALRRAVRDVDTILCVKSWPPEPDQTGRMTSPRFAHPRRGWRGQRSQSLRVWGDTRLISEEALRTSTLSLFINNGAIWDYVDDVAETFNCYSISLTLPVTR
jgi:hypothetical protein